MEKLLELATILSQQNDFQEILRVASQKAASYLNAETASILMINPRTEQTVKTFFRGGEEITNAKYHALQNQICGWININMKSLIIPDINNDSRFKNVRMANSSVKAVLGVPLKVEGFFIGTLILFNKKDSGEFTESDLSYLEKISIISAPYLRNVQKIGDYFKTPLPEKALITKYVQFGLLGKSKRFIEMLNAIESAAHCDVRVLLEGQSGTGKELVAKAIHKMSQRNQGSFVAIDCGAISANLLESELFGHKRGAFTGANTDRKGLIEEAHHGTLFLDEIANLPLEMQTKLMRVLQENEIRPVGSNKAHKVDVRIISATSVSLEKRVEKGDFREDLYYRLHVYPITIPSLTVRKEDIPLLANHFLKKFAKQQNKKVEMFHEEILEYMKNRPWTGNIRELENFVERLTTLTSPDSGTLGHDILPRDLKKEFDTFTKEYNDTEVEKSLDESVSEFERQLIQRALVKSNWNQSKAARSLKISVQTLRYKMDKLGIQMP